MTALVMGLGLVTAQSTSAGAALPEREITIKVGNQVTYNTFMLKGRVEAWPKGKVTVQRKTCRSCAWKFYKTDTTNGQRRYSTRAKSPSRGRWFYRVRVKGDDSYATSYSPSVSAFLG
jgi:hypothetical protein